MPTALCLEWPWELHGAPQPSPEQCHASHELKELGRVYEELWSMCLHYNGPPDSTGQNGGVRAPKWQQDKVGVSPNISGQSEGRMGLPNTSGQFGGEPLAQSHTKVCTAVPARRAARSFMGSRGRGQIFHASGLS